MSDQISLEDANKLIQQRWGRSVHGKPYYRVARADQKEVLIDHMGTAHIQNKYEYVDPRAYAVEFLVNASNNPEIPANFSYEPLWVFTDENGLALPLLWKAIEFLINTVENGPKRTVADYIEEERKKTEAWKDETIGRFEDASCKSSNPDLVTGETISMSGRKK